MSEANAYVIWAYAISLGLLWGYAIHLWASGRSLRRQQRSRISPTRS